MTAGVILHRIFLISMILSISLGHSHENLVLKIPYKIDSYE